MDARNSAGRDLARSSGRPWPAHADGAHDPARAHGAWRSGFGARRARGGRRDHAGPLRAGRQRRAMVRPTPACAHPPLYDRPSARGDRAGRGARFPAFPFRLAARRRQTRGWRDRTRLPPVALDARGFRGARQGLGDGNPVSPPQGLRAVLARRRMPGGADRLVAPHSASGRRRRPLQGARAGDADRAARPAAIPVWTSLAPPYAAAAADSPRRRPCSTASPRTAPFSSTRSPTGARMLRAQVEEALGELVALGLVTSDLSPDLRALLTPTGQRKPLAGTKRRGRVLPFDIESGGRWALVRRAPPQKRRRPSRATPRSSMSRARSPSLRRRVLAAFGAGGGVAAAVARSACASTGGSKARGEIRGGRFVAGFSGEQFAAPEAIGLLREIRRKPTRANGCLCRAPIRSTSSAF